MADETRTIESLCGPYRGQRLTVSAADADAAIADHWAIDPFAEVDPEAEPHPPLTTEEQAAAVEAALAWQDAQLEAAEGMQPKDTAGDVFAAPPRRPRGRPRKDMSAGNPGSYETR